MRMHASWFGSQRPTGYKVAARTPRAATASSPRTRHPDHTERAAVLGSIKARPGNGGACGQRRATAGLDSPCARRPPTRVGRGEETGFKVEQRNWYEGSGECREIMLDFESPIQGREARRHAGPAADQVRTDHQPQDRQGARPYHPGNAVGHCRQSDRMRHLATRKVWTDDSRFGSFASEWAGAGTFRSF